MDKLFLLFSELNRQLAFSIGHSIIGRILVFQTGLLIVAIFGTAAFLLMRSHWQSHAEVKLNDYNDLIVSYLFGAVDPQQRRKTPALWLWQEDLYRDVILNQMSILVGQERTKLIGLYTRLGYFKRDKANLKSWAWWRRLRAIIRMDTLSAEFCRASFLEALDDKHPLVILAATRALSRLEKLTDPMILFTSLERAGLNRRDALIEVINNIGAQSGPEMICQYFKKCSNPDMAIACIHVLGELRAIEAIPVLLQLLKEQESLGEELLSKILDSLKLIGDPESCQHVRKLLTHPSDIVRAKTILLLNELGDQESLEFINSLKQSDQAVEVQRVLQQIENVRKIA